MGINLDGLKAAVDDIVKAAENVGQDVVNQEAGVAQEDVDALTSSLQSAHSKLGAPAPAAVEAPAGEGTGSAGAGTWTPPPAEPAAGS